AVRPAAVAPLPEPARALGRRPVRPRFRVHLLPGLLLETVVADRCCRAEGLLGVTGVELVAREVDLVVERTVEGPGRLGRGPAARLRAAGEQDDRRTGVRLAGGRELPGPEVLNVLGHELDELERRVVTLDRALPRRRRRIRKRIDRRHTSAATAAPGDQIDDQGNHQQPYAAATCPADRNGKGNPPELWPASPRRSSMSPRPATRLQRMAR